MVTLVCCHLTRTNPPKHANWVIFASVIILDCEYVLLKSNKNHDDDVQLLLKISALIAIQTCKKPGEFQGEVIIGVLT